MQPIPIPIEKEEWLSEALKKAGYPVIPTNTILKKTLPGLGATYMEISTKISLRHSIIIEPNVPVIIGKTKDKPELLGVYEKTTDKKIKDYLKNSNIKYKKILTTPESYSRIIEIFKDKTIKMNLNSDFFCLYDECEKLIQDVDYRDKITQPMNDFFEFENKAMVSATPLPQRDPRFETEGFQTLEVEPQYDYKKNLDLIITNTYEVTAYQKLKELKDSECICIFLNKTDSIDKTINALGIKNDSKIFCSDKSVKKLKKRGYKDVSDKIELPLAKYNFFTCRFFSAVDIVLKKNPDIVILTNLKDAIHTMVDPFTEVIQIYGRFRDKYCKGEIPFNSLTHITNFNPHFRIKSDEDIALEISTYRQTYENHKVQIDTTTNQIEKGALEEDLERFKYTELLDDSGNYNYFSEDNLYNEERVKGYYSNPELLVQAYQDTGHFYVNEEINDSPFLFDFFNFKNKNSTTKELRKKIVDELDNLTIQKQANPDFDFEPTKELFRIQEITSKETGEFMVDAFDYLGKEEIERIGYGSLARLKTALDKAKAIKKELDYFDITLEEIKRVYKIDDKKPKNEFKEFISDIYSDNGIEIKVAQNTIRNYCWVTQDNSKTPPTFTIQGFKNEFGEKDASGRI